MATMIAKLGALATVFALLPTRCDSFGAARQQRLTLAQRPPFCTRTALPGTYQTNEDDSLPCAFTNNNKKKRYQEISRRVALVTAAALAAGVSPVQAASLERQVVSLETANLATVNTAGAPEKHLPTVTVSSSSKNDNNNENTVQVVVPHVMDAEKPHYIQYIWLKDIKSNKVVAVQAFQATDASPPTLTATAIPKGSVVKALLYCNLHGLWEGENIAV